MLQWDACRPSEGQTSVVLLSIFDVVEGVRDVGSMTVRGRQSVLYDEISVPGS